MTRKIGSKNKQIKLNTIRVVGEFTIIYIRSKKYGLFECIIDTEDYEKLNFCTWCISKNKSGTFYAQSSKTNKNMHTYILNGKLIDHINGNGLDNRKQNLRIATRSGNASNCKLKDGKFKGVSKARNGKYYARICVDKSLKYLGTFDTQEEAASSYNDEAIKYFGEFSRLNKIED